MLIINIHYKSTKSLFECDRNKVMNIKEMEPPETI